jgi:hypothetical protein
MKNKLIELMGSVRFWMIVIFAGAYLLDQLGVIPGAYAKAVEMVAGIGVVIRQVDKYR